MLQTYYIYIYITFTAWVAWVDRTKLNYFYILYLYYYYYYLLLLFIIILESKKKEEKDKVETMGGVGGHPPKYSIIKVK